MDSRFRGNDALMQRTTMDERLFARLHASLAAGEAAVVASVIETRGATPRKGGSRMLVAAQHSESSVGGGEMEARVMDAARALLRTDRTQDALDIDLSGRPGAAGVCGGRMRVALRRWHGADDRDRAHAVAQALRAGEPVTLSPGDLGDDDATQQASPDARLLIVGGGHCGLALYDLARHLDFDLWVFDQRADCFADGRYAGAMQLSGDQRELARALTTSRDVYAVLLNRDFASDVATLRVLAERPPHFLGMMGSRRRIAEVVAALGDRAAALPPLNAPVGLDIGAETPHEIAVSIIAQLIRNRAGAAASATDIRPR
jgi:xanthine dehydrogenase accessory factor